MAKSKRTPRAKNKIEGGAAGELIKVETDPTTPAIVQRLAHTAVPRSTLFTAEFEAVIEIIATERVYRAMLAGLGRRLLHGPAQAAIDSSIVE